VIAMFEKIRVLWYSRDLDSESPKKREKAVIALGNVEHWRAADLLVGMLKDENEMVRGMAAYGLSNNGDERAVEPLIGMLSDSSKFVRANAAKALTDIGDERVLGPLVELLKSDPENAMDVAYLLGKFGAPGIAVLRAALSGKESWARSAGAFGLAHASDSASAPEIIGLLKDPDASVRASAASALSSLHIVKAVEPLIPLLEDSDAKVRKQAIITLGRLRDVRAAERLIKIMAKGGEEGKDSVEALYWIGLPAVGALVAESRRTHDIRMLRAISTLLGEIDEKSRKKEHDFGVRETAVMRAPPIPKEFRKLMLDATPVRAKV